MLGAAGVAFDTVGPGATGTGSAATPLSWTHTTGAGANAILVGVNLNDSSDHTMTATCNGTGMTSLGLVDVNGATTVTGYVGYIQLFLATTSVVASSGNAIVVTCSGTPDYSVNGGSLSFSGYTGHGTAAVNHAAVTVTVASNTSGNVIAGFFTAGNTITQAGAPATGRFLENYEGNSAYDTGNSAGATAPATGSSVTITWATSAGTNCAIAVEMQGAAGGGGVSGGATVTASVLASPAAFPAPTVTAGGGGSVTVTPVKLAAPAAFPAPTVVTPGATVTPAVLAAPATFPAPSVVTASYITGLAGGATGYFADQNGQPRLVWGDAAWALCGNAGRWTLR